MHPVTYGLRKPCDDGLGMMLLLLWMAHLLTDWHGLHPTTYLALLTHAVDRCSEGDDVWGMFGGRGLASAEGRDGRLNELWTFHC